MTALRHTLAGIVAGLSILALAGGVLVAGFAAVWK